ncbi:MAG: nucleoside triphosphate pyrophosphohydrolase family protein [Patescibacteria group bacterium]
MTLNEYQEKARTTAIYPNQGNNWVYATLGLVGEAGEVAEKMKKAIRDDGGVITPERKEMIVKELGDVLWYIAILAVELGVDLDTIATANLEKLFSRKDRGVLTGSGDER